MISVAFIFMLYSPFPCGAFVVSFDVLIILYA
nr:MAG TPA: hypothetical protein [Caudoviricetes sp.]